MDASEWNTLLVIAEQPNLSPDIIRKLRKKLSPEAVEISREIRHPHRHTKGNGKLASSPGADAIRKWVEQNARAAKELQEV